MKHILYIGNNLSSEKTNQSAIQTLGRLLEAEGYELRYASHFNNKVLRFFHMLWSCLKHSKWADAVLIDTYSTQNFYFALGCSQLCRLIGLPYFPILHGGDLPTRLKKSPKSSCLIFQNSEKNISPSLYLKHEFEAKGFSNMLHIPNSIEIENYPFKHKEYQSIKLLWVRSFSKIYNPEMAVYVLKQLLDIGYKAELCMIGPDAGGYLNKVKQLASDLEVKVEFTGKLTKQEWIKKSAYHNIFINTTNFDNAPVSLMEAMALGFPVVSTNAGGLPFLIEDGKGGFLVGKNDTQAMVNKIVEIFENQKVRMLVTTNARKKAESFDWQVVKQQWQSVFNEL